MKNWLDCKHILEQNNAPDRLIKHLEIVSSVSFEISSFFIDYGINHDHDLVICGAGLHDFGKIVHPEELIEHGSNHELDGQKLLLSLGIDPKIANFCISHSSWSIHSSFEELLVSLSDKIWKGSRVEDLELLVIDFVAKHKNIDRWSIFQELDSFFEHIADGATNRLEKSKTIQFR